MVAPSAICFEIFGVSSVHKGTPSQHGISFFSESQEILATLAVVVVQRQALETSCTLSNILLKCIIGRVCWFAYMLVYILGHMKKTSKLDVSIHMHRTCDAEVALHTESGNSIKRVWTHDVLT